MNDTQALYASEVCFRIPWNP